MNLLLLKIFLLVIGSALVLTACQKITQPITNVAQVVTGTVQIEQEKQAQKTAAIVNCQTLCQDKLSNDGIDLSTGPCLSDNLLPDWVCDIAHSPRQAVDDDSKNQCSAWRTGDAHHFVEVDGNCNLIKVY